MVVWWFYHVLALNNVVFTVFFPMNNGGLIGYHGDFMVTDWVSIKKQCNLWDSMM